MFRKGALLARDKLLKSRLIENLDMEKEPYGKFKRTKLYPKNEMVDSENLQQFNELEGDIETFEFVTKTNLVRYIDYATGEETGGKISETELIKSRETLMSIAKKFNPKVVEEQLDKLIKDSPAEKALALKVGAVVMSTANLDLENGICNGSTGEVIGFIRKTYGTGVTKVFPKVRFYKTGTEMVIPMRYWQSQHYPTLAVGQYPLKLAWAMSIHKSQGATLDFAEIDVGSSIFATGRHMSLCRA